MYRFMLKKLLIGLIHDEVTRTKQEIFSNLRNLRVVSTRVFFSSLLLWEFVHVKICDFKLRLGDEMCSPDVILHKGY